jgi:hypothetical protein
VALYIITYSAGVVTRVCRIGSWAQDLFPVLRIFQLLSLRRAFFLTEIDLYLGRKRGGSDLEVSDAQAG